MKNTNQTAAIDNALACRAKAKSIRESIEGTHSAAVAEKLRAVAQQWDNLASDYENSIIHMCRGSAS